MHEIILCLILVPVLAGTVILGLPSEMSENRTVSHISVAVLGILAVLSVLLLGMYHKSAGAAAGFTIFSMTENLGICFRPDDLGIFFMGFIPLVWLLGGIFSLEYLKHETRRKRFWGFYLLTLGALHGLSLSGNLVTMYLFFEMMTLVSMPLVL
ncbi:MAG: proton-conducting membrane transporter, partial [Dorea sp.]|nr:proton-conducting membrane transporter [Dorea sp.]